MSDTILYNINDGESRLRLTAALEVEAEACLLDPDDAQLFLEIQTASGGIDLNKHVIEPVLNILSEGFRVSRYTSKNWSEPVTGDFVYIELDAATFDADDGVPKELRSVGLWDWLRTYSWDSRRLQNPSLIHIQNADVTPQNVRRFASAITGRRGPAIIFSGIRGGFGWENLRGKHVLSGFAVIGLSLHKSNLPI